MLFPALSVTLRLPGVMLGVTTAEGVDREGAEGVDTPSSAFLLIP